MLVVYRLKDDLRKIASIQKATSESERFGIEPTHGLVGSDEWWNGIRSGKLECSTLRGTISRVTLGSTRDWPEFELTTEAGDRSTWVREANTAELALTYATGRPVEIDYVIQRHRPKSKFAGAEIKLILEIRLGDRYVPPSGGDRG